MTNVLQGFSMILEPYDYNDISAAFKEWMGESANMPTPSDILKIVKRKVESRRDNYSKYLERPDKVDKTPPKHDWSALTDSAKKEFLSNMRHMPESVKPTYAKVMGYDYEKVEQWILNNTNHG